ncbi:MULTISPECIES: hypothetical protein [Shouchella]|uniref:Uncharacterized protein n=2 Tax=Shouchella TaxID=2893057 RepID=A0ABY7W5V4_9BACI|nr:MULTISPECIES: hypothetical protein [Shouchella]MED4130320.1 hypothetical protein [Shouchella miscanthi]WDF04342.1 hypothetical protein PQ477_02350 [Shouchella hunanensis]GAF24143.1 hypothetical protein JCM19047_4017 [Bacillus sp. JCM 19047]
MHPLPFSHTWPYEVQGKDIYIEECPFCKQEHVLTNMKPKDVKRAKEQFKVRLNMPCCHTVMTIIEADDDYFWADQPLRG